MDAYDVIIIGTGAGGGTLARAPRAVRQADPPARARRLAPARAAELARAGRVRRQPVRVARHVVRREGPAFQPQVHYFVGGATKLYGAALYRLRQGGLRRAPPPRRDLARVADLLRRARALLHAGRAARTRCTAPAARIRPSRRRARRIRSRPSPTSPGSSSSRTISRPPAYHPFHAPCGIRLNEANMPYSACVRCRTATASPARAREVGRRGARGSAGARAPERHAADEREGRSGSTRTTAGTSGERA